MGKVKLKRLKIDKYRNVAPGTELVFNDGFNVLLGQNGTGKTTLLKLIAMVTKSSFKPLKDDFALEYEFTCSQVTVTVTVAVQQSEIRSDYHVINTRGESPSWSYRIAIQIADALESHIVSSTPLSAKYEISTNDRSSPATSVPVIAPHSEQFFFRSLSEVRSRLNDKVQKELLRQAAYAFAINYANSGRFDETLGAFEAMCDSLELESGDRLYGASLTVADSKKTPRVTLGLFFPVALMPTLSKITTATPESVRINHVDVEFLNDAVRLLGFSGAEMIAHLIKKESDDKDERLTYGNLSFLFVPDHTSIIDQEALSYGQKRLLSFLYYIAANEDIAIADELVNGLHYDWIEVCLKRIGDRQSFLTSQNPLLLDFLPFDMVDDVRRTFILCSLDEHNGGKQIGWKNISSESAESFFHAYKTQALQVSEILRSRGLW